MKPTIKIRFTEPQIALVTRAHPNCNLDHLTELSFEFDHRGKIIDCIGKIKNEGNIPSRRARALLQDGTPLNGSSTGPVQRYWNFQTARGVPMRRQVLEVSLAMAT
jgi:hypothetical protein